MARHAWLNGLSRRGWAWEFLRRNPRYRADYACHRDDFSKASQWGLLRFCDPFWDATAANTFWRFEDANEVLRLATQAQAEMPSVALSLDGLLCSTSHLELPGHRREILFRDGGRSLQVSISGEGCLSRACVMVLSLNEPSAILAHIHSLRRLSDLLMTKTMRAPLYPPECRAPRLASVMTALDGFLAGLPHREIAIEMFGAHRVSDEWCDPRQHMRDRVRRAIRCGRDLMNGSYRQLLRSSCGQRATGKERRKADTMESSLVYGASPSFEYEPSHV